MSSQNTRTRRYCSKNTEIRSNVKQSSSRRQNDGAKDFSNSGGDENDLKPGRIRYNLRKRSLDSLTDNNDGVHQKEPKESKIGLSTKSPGKKGFKPKVLCSTKHMDLNFTQTRKSPRILFKPSVTSTDQMHLNFDKMKTPSHTDLMTPKTNPRKSTGSMVQRKSSVTPFKFTGSLNVNVDGRRSTKKAKKSSFGLKASLSNPMTWKMHKSKLKSLNQNDGNSSAKSPTVQAREERRISAMNKRTDIKFNNLMTRRGIAL